jgi:type IV pilus assembly protein PilW
MVALAIGLAVMAGVLGLVTNSLRANSESVKTMRLNQEMRAALDLMVRDIRRAGYRQNYTTLIGSVAPGAVLDNTVQILDSGGRIQFQYDLNDDGTLSTSTESFGFRLSGGAIQYTINALADTPVWQSLTDPNVITVTALSFCLWSAATAPTACPTDVPSDAKVTLTGSAQVSVFNVRITLRAQIKNDASTLRQLTDNVRVRNDRFDNISP